MEDSEDCTLFDVSSENDSLIAADASSSTLAHYQFSESKGFEQIGDLGVKEVDCMSFSNRQKEQLLETAEPETLRKTGKCNLRKSLAWDSAFFESPGFLDTEELSTMIEGAENGKTPHLPGIEEDIDRSTESISTLLSNNLTLESLEADLFEDIRASIQKSSKASSMATPNYKTAQKEAAVKKVDVASQNRVAKNAASTSRTMGMQGGGRIIKKDSSHLQVKQVITKPEAPSTITKRVSLGANRIKIETNNSKVGGKGIQVPKSAGLAGLRSVPKPAVSLKTSSLATFDAIKEPGSSSSSSTSKITLPKVQKSSLPSARRKTESRPVNQPSSCSIPKASSKVPLRKKPSDKSGLSTFLPLSKISSSISPSSSISEWSSVSSSTSTVNQRLQSRAYIDKNSSCSTVNQRFLSRTSIDTNSSCRSMDVDTHSVSCSHVQSNDDIPDGILNHVKELSSQDTTRTSLQSGVLSRSALKKPSGLRMPSPKIGFFDGAKSMVRTPTGCRQSQSCLPTRLPKIGAAIHSPIGGSKKGGEVMLPPGRKTTAGASTMLNTSKSGSPKPSSESSGASTKGIGAPTSVLRPSISSELSSSKKKGFRKITTSTYTELECLKSASPKQFQEASSVSPGITPEVHNETDGSKGLKTDDVEMGKADGAGHTLVNAAQAENNENLYLNI